MSVPTEPKIFHITHLDNLPQLVSSGCLLSDAQRIKQNLACQLIGMSSIKRRRLEEIEVGCHPGTKVGEYVPFYFCPRSIMLYILHKANNSDLHYRGGQRPIVHLQADLAKTIAWAENNSVRWAFSDRNAGTRVVEFFSRWKDLDQVNWAAVQSNDFSNAFAKEGKQAEFLLYNAFPWELVEKIGVIDHAAKQKVGTAIATSAHQPPIAVERGWYY